MRMLLGIVCYSIATVFYTHAATNDSSKSSRSPKLGGTIVERKMNVDDDIATLQQAIVGTGNVPNSRLIIELMANRTYSQRMKLVDAYKTKTNGKSLDYDLYIATKHTARGDIRYYLLTTTDEILHGKIEESLDKSKDWAYMSILCTSAETRLKALNGFQYKKYENSKSYSLGKRIDKGLRQEEGRTLLNFLINPQPRLRPESGLDQSKVKDQAKLIPQDGNACKTSNNDLMMLMTKESFDQIKAVDEEYRRQNNNFSIVQQIDKVCTGDVREAYRRIVSYAVDPFGYFADEFYLGLTDRNHGWIRML
ncbi:hypothetical protein LSTR_LSTR012265 [Laodelphax striatellus]|uniref:Annexin n=1 Tax=Laodelphax striatellus TaxID=195883 RepID=A0A482WKB5_LAOST|nr:hypothetical protein LSTR_LSTR012265 [Laodelphax striatellus]